MRRTTPLQQLVDILGPAVMQQPRQRSVGEDLAAGLAARAVVRFVLGVDDALYRCAADRAWLAVAPVHGHRVVERGDLFRERVARVVAQHTADLRLVAVLSLVSCFAALILGVTLYAITRGEGRDLALLALVCRVIEGVPGVSGTLGLVWLTTAADAQALDPAAAQALGAYLMRGEAGTGAIFFAVASTLFAWLMLRGRLVPAWLAWLGVVASVLLVVVLPLQLGGVFVGGALSWASAITWLVWLPMLVYEVTLAGWLIVKGVAASQRTPS